MKEKDLKKKQFNQNGITLIALVITIIVLLILAGVSIATLTGENGILTRAEDANVESRGASVEEARNLWFTEKNMNNEIGETTQKSLEDLINELVNEGLLTEDEKDIILGNEEKGIEAKYQITIGSHFIDFSTGEQEGIDYENLAPGLYETGTDNMIKSWEDLKKDGELSIYNGQLIVVQDSVEGDLVISEEITSVNQTSFLPICGGNENVTGLVIPSTILGGIWCDQNEGIRMIYCKNGFSGSIRCYECTNLKFVRMPTYICWKSLSGGGNILFNADKQSYRTYAESILNELPTDEAQRNAAIDELFIDAVQYYKTKISEIEGQPDEIVIDSVGDALSYYYQYSFSYSSLQEFYVAEMEERNLYTSFEDFVIDIMAINPEGFDANI